MRAMLLLLLLPTIGFADVVVPADRVENSVNIRMHPDATSDVVGTLAQGESLPHVDSQEGWHEVQLEADATGFVSSDWSKVIADEPAAEEAAEEVAEEAPVEAVAEEAPVEAVANVADEAAETVIEEVAEATEVDAAASGAVADVEEEPAEEIEEPVAETKAADTVVEVQGPPGPPGPPGPRGPAGSGDGATIKGTDNYVIKFRNEFKGGNSQIYDNGNQVGIGTTEPKQRLEVNGNIQIHEQNSSVAGLMITQSSGETGYIMHNRASTLTIGAGSQDRITIDRNGNVGIGIAKPSHPLEMASGAHVTAGGVWTNRSSREAKENVEALSPEEALAALLQLEPVTFNYRDESAEGYVGFIAEDVPDLLATGDRQGLSAMDIVAVLTRVVQQQQRQIEELESRLPR